MSSGRRSRKKHHEEEHENHERWLVSYADMVTLLMCLFIVLFAISQVDKTKFAALSEGLQQGFGAPMSVLDSGMATSDPTVEIVRPNPVDIKNGAGVDNGKDTEQYRTVQAQVEADRSDRVRVEAETNYRNLDQVRRRIEKALRDAGYPNAAQYDITTRGLVVSIVADQVLFDSARAALRPEGATILNAVAPPLRALPNPLAVEGHTNQLRLLPGSKWPSDWELSATRATTVLRHLSGVGRIPENRMYAAGFADTRPLIDPSNPASITKNRRVDVVVLSTASAESNELLPALDAAHHSH